MNTPRLLREWREAVSPKRLADFEEALASACGGHAAGGTLKRFGHSLHLGLLSQPLRRAAMKVSYGLDGNPVWRPEDDAGVILCREIAQAGGDLAPEGITPDALHQAGRELLRRGVLFEEGGRWHAPVEILMECASSLSPLSLYALGAGLSKEVLRQLVDEEARASLSQPTPTVFEMAAWWAVHAHRALGREKRTKWPEELRDLVLRLAYGGVEDEEEMQRLLPDFDLSPVTRYDGYFGQRWVQSVRASLEAGLPRTLREAMLRGLAGIVMQRGDPDYAALVLPEEARKALKERLNKERETLAAEIRRHWETPAPSEFEPSPWRRDHDVWRVWAALHFMELRITRQRKLSKPDSKRIARLLDMDGTSVQRMALALHAAGLAHADAETMRLEPVPFDAEAMARQMRHALAQEICGVHLQADDPRVTAMWDALRDLPADVWLNILDALEWLQLRSGSRLQKVDWGLLFQARAGLAEMDEAQTAVRFPPALLALANGEPPALSSPGWVGAAGGHPQAKPLVSPVGEIQWPPDAALAPLLEIRDFLQLERIEHMLTLSVDDAALRRASGDEAALRKVRETLERWVQPLPQALARRLDRWMTQKPAARAAAASMVLMAEDPAALAKIGKQGFALHRPFDDLPGLLVLDADENAHAFLEACKEAGVHLQVALPPRRWIEGQAAIKEWTKKLYVEEGEAWVEVESRRSASAAPKRRIGTASADWHYDEISFLPFRRTRTGWKPAKKPMRLRTNHMVRLRELAEDEIRQIEGDA